MPSMPKVRLSSGTIGTTYLPIFLSRQSELSARTKHIVVEISRSPVSFSSASKIERSGISSFGASSCLRCGKAPPSASRRFRM